MPYECTLDDEDASEPSEWRTATASGALRLPTGNEWQLLRTYALAAGEAGTGSPWFKEQAGDRGRYSRRRETDHGEVQPNELGIHHLLGNVAELRHELEGTAVRREVVLGGHVALSEEDVLANEYQQEVYWDEDHDHIGFRLILEVRIR